MLSERVMQRAIEVGPPLEGIPLPIYVGDIILSTTDFVRIMTGELCYYDCGLGDDSNAEVVPKGKELVWHLYLLILNTWGMKYKWSSKDSEEVVKYVFTGAGAEVYAK
jgi:hypothetical protein